jgi:Family of unknown function (DUF5906)
MASVPPNPALPSALSALQGRFALSRIGGEFRVIDLNEAAAVRSGSGLREVSFFSCSDGKLLMRRFLEGYPVQCDPRRVIQDFFHDPGTLEYNAAAFDPRPTPLTTLNLWVQPPVQPVKGDWSVIRSYLHDIVCDGDTGSFDYFLGYLAHMRRCPAEKPGVMPVLLGGQGAGKGTIYKLLKVLWPGSTLFVSKVDDIIGRFNSSLGTAFVVFLDEAIFRGDFKALDSMKSLITEPEITVEAKFQPRRTVSSFHRFFAASNHRHFAHVEPDDRRFLFLRVSETRKGDLAYFEKVHSAIGDPVTIAALVHDLLALDLSAFNVRQRPKTAEHMEQKIQSLRGFDRYWFDVLWAGDFAAMSIVNDNWDSGRFVSSATLKAGFEAFQKANRFADPFIERDLSEALKRLCSSAVKSRRKEHGTQQRGYDLPVLEDARKDFEKVIGPGVDWPQLPASRSVSAALPGAPANDSVATVPAKPQVGGPQ